MSSREQFEAWMTAEQWFHDSDFDWDERRNCYSQFGIHLAYKSWQAATNATEAKCAALAAENAGLKSWAQVRATSDDALEQDNYMTLKIDWRQRSLAEIKTSDTDSFLAEVRAQGVKSLSNAVQSVISERQRQQSVEGWTPEHDDQYGESQLLLASSCYVLNTIQPFNRIPMDWPWAPEWWKPTNPRRDLVKAGSLILAEIERIDRQEAAQ